MAANPVVIIFGDVDTSFKLLFRKLKKLAIKLNNVSMALCCGNFFKRDCDEEWNEIKRGNLKAPLQIYILGPTSEALKKFYPDCHEMTDLAERITFLGKSGSFRTAEGVKLVYLSGSFSASKRSDLTYSYEDINKVTKDTLKEKPDFLLTWSWPHHFGQLVKTHPEIKYPEIASTFLFSTLGPQYHIAARERKLLEVSAQRIYKDGGNAGISRFIGLSNLEVNANHDWIKALTVTPTKSDNTRECTDLIPLHLNDIGTFMANQCHPTVKPVSMDEKRFAKPRPYKKFEVKEHKCWFCTSNPNFDKHMVIAMGDFSYLALAKGPLTQDHTIICSVEHIASMRLAEEDLRFEIERFKLALREMYENSVTIFFERVYRTCHLQIHCIPIPNVSTTDIVSSFKILANKYGLKINEVLDTKMCYMTLKKDDEYFHVDLSEGHELIIAGNLERLFPLNFGREALACESLLNIPEKLNWRECEQTKDEEIKIVETLKKKFQKFDFTVL
ncbi:hypothetical protein O3M35_003891 [Rhynocoris fuscipes]|uniref:CWF19-like protein 1 n=1 Tax=Rhynocoris fuscipes TaxID=488301 RepID=A0AAW1CNZ8_9HEMI